MDAGHDRGLAGGRAPAELQDDSLQTHATVWGGSLFLLTLYEIDSTICIKTFVYLQGARIWMPDATEVWRAAELLEDFKAIPCKLKILYEEAEVR